MRLPPVLAVDLLRSAVAGDDGEEIVDDPRIGIQQERVELVEPVAGNRQPMSEIGAWIHSNHCGHSRLHCKSVDEELALRPGAAADASGGMC